MHNYLPVLIVGAVIGLFSLAFLVAYTNVKSKIKAQTKDRNMPDKEIVRRLLSYAAPYKKQFALVLVIMLISIVYDLLSPTLIGQIEELIKGNFPLKSLFIRVGLYAGILIVSMVSMYFQTMILQKIGQKILSDLREDVFTHRDVVQLLVG